MKPVDQARNARAFLEDETHQQAFDKLIWSLRERRDTAAREVPEWEQLRELASQIKEHTLSNLAHYLELFEARAQRNGVNVHWARDAQEHNQIVYELLAFHGVSRVVKSKSMLTEECDTREFLERRFNPGHRDRPRRANPAARRRAAEYIVGPAFQKTTQDVAELFHRVYGSDPTKADAVYLAMSARRRPSADPPGRGGNDRRQLRGRRDRRGRNGDQRGQRRSSAGQSPPAADLLGRHREDHSPALSSSAVFIRGLLTHSAAGGSASPNTPPTSAGPNVLAAICTSCSSTTVDRSDSGG